MSKSCCSLIPKTHGGKNKSHLAFISGRFLIKRSLTVRNRHRWASSSSWRENEGVIMRWLHLFDPIDQMALCVSEIEVDTSAFRQPSDCCTVGPALKPRCGWLEEIWVNAAHVGSLGSRTSTHDTLIILFVSEYKAHCFLLLGSSHKLE